ncbi:hypothetical protein QJS66_21890 [Kocuria rhizophila]|nr:hypothetical protein QJS66_21890 [Kocuria rhizophila]
MSQPNPLTSRRPWDKASRGGQKPQDVRGKSQSWCAERSSGKYWRGHLYWWSCCSSCCCPSCRSDRSDPAGGSGTWNTTGPVVDGGEPTLSLLPPSMGEHPFGQDNLGRDLFAMLMQGTQYSPS